MRRYQPTTLPKLADQLAGQLAGGLVVVLEADVPRIVAVHADTVDGADPDDDLAWYAAQELDSLTRGIV